LTSAQEIPRLGWLYVYLTRACNLRCAHCWLSAGPAAALPDAIAAGDVLRLARQALPLGLREVRITGGEPMLAPSFEHLVKGLADLGTEVRVETNATLVTAAIARTLAACRATVGVSLDGDAMYHDQVRGFDRAYGRALRGIGLLRDQGVEVSLVMALRRGNAGLIPHVAGVAADFAIGRVKVNPVTAMGRATQLDDLLSAADLLELMRRYIDAGEDGPAVDFELPHAFWPLSSIKRVGVCHYLQTLSLLADGALAMCGLGFDRDDWRLGRPDADLASIWNEHPLLVRVRADLPGRLEGICGRCLFLPACGGGCRALALVAHGSWAAPFPKCEELAESGLFPPARLKRGA